MKISDKVFHHFAAITGFIIVALIYFYPVLQGKEISQSDIIQYTGMAKEQNDFRQSHKAEPYWTNGAFAGMPTYQLGAQYPHNYVKMLDNAIRFLPRPADYLFLYFASFYVLMLVLKSDPLKAFFGALAFGLSTYLIIILGVGHNAKAHAIGYMPLVFAGFLLVFQQRYVFGGLLTLFAAALEINANHFQMTYYLLLFLLMAALILVYPLIKQKQFLSIGKILVTFLGAAILAIGANATNLLATAEYADFSTRGKSDLTFAPDGKPRTSDLAMSSAYITEYSYGLTESLNLFVPRLFGGSNSEDLGTSSDTYKLIVSMGAPEDQARDFASTLPMYWGGQPIVAAPAYLGAVVLFLAILGILLVKNRFKYVLLVGALLSLILSWGKNIPWLTNAMIDYFPLYNKFRAISSIQVILELTIPALAILGWQAFFSAQQHEQRRSLLLSAGITLFTLLLLFFSKGAFSYQGAQDDYYLQLYGFDFVQALIQDRKTLFLADLLRTGFFTSLAAVLLFFTMKGKLKQTTAVVFVGLLMVADLFLFDKKYVNKEAFVHAIHIRQPFEMTDADRGILEDSSYYRVLDLDGNLNSARASYFHKSLGGYHAAKPRRLQELFDYQIARNNDEIYNMLNVKYLMKTDQDGQLQYRVNQKVYGHAWYVSTLKRVRNADAEMKALTKINQQVAVVNEAEFGDKLPETITQDTSATIQLVAYQPNQLKYQSSAQKPGLALFSEMYYPHGWKASIDGREVPHFRANYVLRALSIPAGKHTIEFKFEPEIIKTGGTLSLASCILMLMLLAGGIYYQFRQRD